MSFDFRKARLFLELRQIDVSLATGVSIRQIAAAERGEYIHPHESGLLRQFLRERLRDELGNETKVLMPYLSVSVD